MKDVLRLACSLLLATGLLSACGGGITVGFFDDGGDSGLPDAPFPSGRAASVTVSAASDPALDGVYASNDAPVGHVVRFFGNPDTCRFRFDGLQQQAGARRVLSGEIRYVVNSTTVLTTIVQVDTREFRQDGGSGATVDRSNGAILYSGAVLADTQGLGQRLTLDGRIPLRNEARPAGC